MYDLEALTAATALPERHLCENYAANTKEEQSSFDYRLS